MKIIFGLKEDKILVYPYEEVKKILVSEEKLTTCMDIAHRFGNSIWDILDKEIVYLSVKGKYGNFITIKAFIVRKSNGEILIWSNKYIYIEDKDVCFTIKEEAKKFTALNNKYVCAEFANKTAKDLLEDSEKVMKKVKAEINQVKQIQK